MVVRVASMLIGCVILAAGMSIVINSNAGTGPNDLVAVILSDKIEKVEFRWVRVGCDLFFVVLGFFLGEPWEWEPLWRYVLQGRWYSSGFLLQKSL